MSKITDPNEHDTRRAAEALDAMLPGKGDVYWRWLLTNNRRNDRNVVYRIPYRRAGKRVVYRISDLTAYANHVKQRTKASRPSEGSSKPPRGKYSWEVTGRQSSEDDGATITLKATGFTFSLSLDPEQARSLAEQLLRHADRLEGRDEGSR